MRARVPREKSSDGSVMQRQSRSGIHDGTTAPTSSETTSSTLIPGQGSPLGVETRARMEPFFGHDFSQVRIHADDRAAASAEAANARAYTVGPDIVFGAGQYQPASSGGKQLLAHELTHVVQQAHVQAPASQPSLDLRIGAVSDRYEAEAERTSRWFGSSRMGNGPSISRSEVPQPALQRTEETSAPQSTMESAEVKEPSIDWRSIKWDVEVIPAGGRTELEKNKDDIRMRAGELVSISKRDEKNASDKVIITARFPNDIDAKSAGVGLHLDQAQSPVNSTQLTIREEQWVGGNSVSRRVEALRAGKAWILVLVTGPVEPKVMKLFSLTALIDVTRFNESLVEARHLADDDFERVATWFEADKDSYETAYGRYNKILNDHKRPGIKVIEKLLDAMLKIVQAFGGAVISEPIKAALDGTDAILKSWAASAAAEPPKSLIKTPPSLFPVLTSSVKYDTRGLTTPEKWRAEAISKLRAKKKDVKRMLDPKRGEGSLWNSLDTELKQRGVGYIEWDPLTVVQESLQINRVPFAEFETKKVADPLKYEKLLWATWLNQYAYLVGPDVRTIDVLRTAINRRAQAQMPPEWIDEWRETFGKNVQTRRKARLTRKREERKTLSEL